MMKQDQGVIALMMNLAPANKSTGIQTQIKSESEAVMIERLRACSITSAKF